MLKKVTILAQKYDYTTQPLERMLFNSITAGFPAWITQKSYDFCYERNLRSKFSREMPLLSIDLNNIQIAVLATGSCGKLFNPAPRARVWTAAELY